MKQDNLDLKKQKSLAIFAAKSAGRFLIKKFWQIHTKNRFKFKARHEIVTGADKASEKIILSAIKKNFPRDDILSEEVGFLNKIGRDYLWIIDPLDGTTNFSIKNPMFGISIALSFKGEIVLGVIYIPFLKELFFAQKGEGAFLNGRRIFVSRQKNLKNSFLTFCYGSLSEKAIKRAMVAYQLLKLKAYEMRQLGSSVAEFSWVASGRTDAIMTPGANLWDVASGTLLVREAGGRVSDFQDRPWRIKSKDVLASNGKFHDRVLKFLKKI